ncbi:transcription factor AP-2-delta [Lates japonicus]|uniref:Transcription factor AP-2-delta n=1 Tax=Lates japonicus TaxID=270547 RepID=A0AAD3QXK0_LATJO|nr:transcription factor AP-2-delta [Lates japonicus]
MSATFPGLVHDAEIRHDGSNSYRLMQLGCLESVANSSVAYSSSSPLTYPAPAGTEFASPYFSANHQYTPLHHQSFHYEFQHSHPAVAPEAYGLNSLHSGQYYQQIHHGEPADFINLHNARSALKSSCLDEQQRRELGCLDAYRRHDLSLMTSHGSQAYGVGMHHPDQRLLPAAGLGLPPPAADDLQGSVEAQCGLVLNGQGRHPEVLLLFVCFGQRQQSESRRRLRSTPQVRDVDVDSGLQTGPISSRGGFKTRCGSHQACSCVFTKRGDIVVNPTDLFCSGTGDCFANSAPLKYKSRHEGEKKTIPLSASTPPYWAAYCAGENLNGGGVLGRIRSSRPQPAAGRRKLPTSRSHLPGGRWRSTCGDFSYTLRDRVSQQSSGEHLARQHSEPKRNQAPRKKIVLATNLITLGSARQRFSGSRHLPDGSGRLTNYLGFCKNSSWESRRTTDQRISSSERRGCEQPTGAKDRENRKD